MIYLIGGPPRSGKTMLAKKLAARLRIGWVSADILESVVSEYLLKKNRQKLFPKNILRQKTHGSNDEMYEKFSAKKIADAYIQQGKASWKAIDTFVSECVYEGHDFIMEGYQVHPKLIARLLEKFPQDVRGVLLIKKDVQAMMEGFRKSEAKSDWVLQKTKKKETFETIALMLSSFGKRMEDESKKFQIPVYCMDEDFVKQINALAKEFAKGWIQKRYFHF